MVHLQQQQSLADAHSQHCFPARKHVINQCLEFVADVSGPWLTQTGEMIITSVVDFTLASLILLIALQTISQLCSACGVSVCLSDWYRHVILPCRQCEERKKWRRKRRRKKGWGGGGLSIYALSSGHYQGGCVR